MEWRRLPPRLGRAAAVLAAGLVLTTCTSDTPFAPRVPVATQFDISSLIQAAGQFNITIDRVVVEFRRYSDSTIAFVDTIPSGQITQSGDSLRISVQVPLHSSSEQFWLHVFAYGGPTLYYDVQASVTVNAGNTPTTTSPLTPTYVGPGFDADSLAFRLDTTIFAGDSVLVTATAFKAGTAVVPSAPVAFDITPAADTVKVPRPRAISLNQAYAKPKAGLTDSVTITALLPNNLSKTGKLRFAPRVTGTPSSVTLVSGNNQTGPASVALPLPLVVEVRDALSNVVSGTAVTWATPDGGSLAPSGPTGTNGRAQATWTLGPSATTQTATATVAGLTPVVFTATVGQPMITLAFVGLPDVGIGKTVTVRASIPSPAPPSGVAVTLTSDASSVAAVSPPAAVTIAQGATTADFTVSGVAAGSTTLRANATGYTEGTLAINVQVRSISVPPTLNVAFGQTASLPINIGSPAPTGGVVVTVTSDNPTVVGIQTPTVTIAAGATSANAIVQGLLPGSANVAVDNPAYTSDVSVVTTSASLNVIQSSTTLNASFPIDIDIRLESNGAGIAAPTGGISIALTARDPTCVATNSPRSIAAGLVTTTGTLSYGGSATLPCSTYVVANAPNIQSDSVLATVGPVPPINLPSATTLGNGLQVQQSASLGASNHGGTTVRVTSTDPTKVLISPNATTAGAAFVDIPIPVNGTSFSYYVQGLEGQTGAVTVTAAAPGFVNGPSTVTLVQSALDIIFLSATQTTFAPNNAFEIRTGVPNANNTAMSLEQQTRAGGSGLTATVNLSPGAGPPVAELVTSALTAQSVTVLVPSGQSRSAGTAATGGVEFHSLTPGTTTVSAAIPGLIALPTASVAVTITAPVITVNAATVGSGLQKSVSGNLGASNHGGVTVHLVSADPTKVLVAPNGTSTGAGSLDIPVLNGNSSFSFTVQGLEGQTSGATPIAITASVPGFTSGSGDVTELQSALDIIFLGTSTTSLSPNTAFQVRIGVPNGQNTGMSEEQPLRFGSPGASATVTNSTAATAQLVFQAGAAQSGRIDMTAGQSRSAGNAATGGVEFDPIAAGTTTVSATIPGYVALPQATVGVTVTGAGISLNSVSAVGAGLQQAAGGNLGASNHGGVTVHITSSDPTKVLLAPNATSAGAAFVDLPVANGSTGFSYYVQALEGQTGQVTLTASATGFSDGTATATVTQPALDIIFLTASQTTFSANSAFQIRVGAPNSNNTGMSVEQTVRFGAAGLVATVASSAPNVGQLVTQTVTGGFITVPIAANNSRSPGSVATGGVEFDPLIAGNTTVSATIPGFVALPQASVAVTVNAPPITLQSVTVGGGLQQATSGNLGASNHGGVTVRITSSRPDIALVSPNATTAGAAFIDIPVPNNQTGFSYYVQGVEGQVNTVALTATATGFTDGPATATVVQPALDIIFLNSTTTTLSPNTAFQVRIGVPNSNNTGMSLEQGIRFGGTAGTATVTNSNASSAQLVFQAGPAQSGQVGIPIGQARSPGSAATGGVEFKALAAGNTTVSATIPGFIALPTASVAVTITVPGINVSPVTVGSGLQIQSSGSLGASNHGGVTVRITSANPSLFLVAPNTTTAGASFIDVAVANGGTGFSFVIQGLEGQTGAALLTATVTGLFNDGSASETVVQPAADIIFLPSSVSATAANDAFQIRLGTPDALGNNISVEEGIRVGGTALTATITNSNPSAAQLVFQAGAAQSGPVGIAVGQARSPATVATGGVEFDPLAQGATTVSVSIPGYRVIPTSSLNVTVTP